MEVTISVPIDKPTTVVKKAMKRSVSKIKDTHARQMDRLATKAVLHILKSERGKALVAEKLTEAIKSTDWGNWA